MKMLFTNFRLVLSTILMVGILYFLLPEVQASGIPYPAPGGVPGASLSSGGTPQGAVVGFAVLLQRFADGAAALAASVAILFVVINGARLTFAFGNTESLGKAKKGLIWAAIGLIVIIFAYIITKTVIALVYSGSDGSAVIGTADLAPTTTTPGTIDPVNDGEIGSDGTLYLPAGERSLSFYQQGAERTFLVYIPTQLDASKAHPVVMLLHGGGGNAQGMQSITQISNLAERDKFIAVFPEAANPEWNDGRQTTSDPIDDVAYINSLINILENDWTADENKIFVAGLSSGGMMTQRLACELTSSFAGFGVVAANMPSDLASRCNPSDSTPIVFFNGTDDSLMPYDGGDIASIPALRMGAGGEMISVEDTLALWSDKNRCSGSDTEALPDTAVDDTTVEKITYSGCTRGALEAFKVIGGGHYWPGGDGEANSGGSITQDIEATTELVDFFKLHGLSPAS